MRAPKYFLAIVLVSIMAQQAIGSVLQRFQVEVHNDMKSGQKLFLHCKSKDDDLGIQNLAVGQYFSWRFKENFWQTTLYWCYMRNDNSYIALEVFWPESPGVGSLTYKCNEEDCIWSVRDDGIYLKNIPQQIYEFRKKWEPGFGGPPM